jgi:hypothetical protein
MILILKSTQNLGVITEWKRDLVGDRWVLILGSLAAGEAFPLIGEEEDDRSGRGALSAPL